MPSATYGGSRGSSFSIVTRLRVRRLGFDSWQGAGVGIICAKLKAMLVVSLCLCVRVYVHPSVHARVYPNSFGINGNILKTWFKT
jgi:hypothetical protein